MQKLCAIFAHPDDESFSAGATLARYVAGGVRVTLVTATSGEAGEAADERAVDGLAARREGALHDAAAALGIHDVCLLRLPDSHLADRRAELYAALVRMLDEVRPQVIITEDIQGITGHPDHIAVTEVVHRAFDELGGFGLLKLYEHVVLQSVAPPGIYGAPDDYITTTLDVEAWRGQRLEGLRAHRSQVKDEALARFTAFPAPLRDHYICVGSRVPILLPEDDLFAGVSGTSCEGGVTHDRENDLQDILVPGCSEVSQPKPPSCHRG